jgi:hypothetical protein
MEQTKDIIKGDKKFRIKIVQDTDPSSPREDDNLGTMICFHSRYNLGDKHNYQSISELKNKDNVISLPLYLYDHSGITMKTSPFSCSWDSGQVGVIFVSKKRVREEFGVKRISKKLQEKIISYLTNEVETYDQYLTGDVYGYEIYEVVTCSEGHEHENELDSRWGFYGSEHCMEESESVVKYYMENEVEV